MYWSRLVYQSIHGTGLLVMLKPWALLTGDINKARELVSLGVVPSAVTQEDLDHAGVIAGVVAGPWCAILHDPAFRGNLHGFGNQCIDSDFEFFILPLPKTETIEWNSTSFMNYTAYGMESISPSSLFAP